MEDGSMRGAIFTLVATSMETGCLSLPIVLKYAGIVPGIIIIILAALAAYSGMNGISVAASRYKIYDYSKLVKYLLGIVFFYIEHSNLFRYYSNTLSIFFSCWISADMQ